MVNKYEGLTERIKRQVLEQEQHAKNKYRQLHPSKKYKTQGYSTHAIESILVNTPVTSSWINSVGVATIEGDQLVLMCTFHNGVRIGYIWNNPSGQVEIPDFYESWIESVSKGKALNQWFWPSHIPGDGQPYTYLV